METEDEVKNNNPHKNKVHKVLAHSYLFCFVLFLIAICLDLVFRLKIFANPILLTFGILFLIFGTLLIIWAQKTTRKLKKDNENKINRETFCHGPYRFTRIPTNLGLFFLMLGFGIVTNAFFVILFSFIYFIITKFTFLNKEEKILTLKYGAPYLEYKKSVRF